MTVAAQTGDPHSTLHLYQKALRLRRELPANVFAWEQAPPAVIAFSRGTGFICMVNLGRDSVALPEHRDVLAASAPLTPDEQLPADTAVWLRV